MCSSEPCCVFLGSLSLLENGDGLHHYDRCIVMSSFFWIDRGMVFHGVTGGMGMRHGRLGAQKAAVFSFQADKSHFYSPVHICIRNEVADKLTMFLCIIWVSSSFCAEIIADQTQVVKNDR